MNEQARSRTNASMRSQFISGRPKREVPLFSPDRPRKGSLLLLLLMLAKVRLETRQHGAQSPKFDRFPPGGEFFAIIKSRVTITKSNANVGSCTYVRER